MVPRNTLVVSGGEVTMRLFFSALTLLVIAAPTTGQVSQDPLTQKELEAAIESGVREDPRPYTLPGSGDLEDVPAAALRRFGPLVFTPYLRVQFAASQEWQQSGRRLTPQQVPPEVLAPIVLIALPDELHRHWPGSAYGTAACQDSGEMEFSLFPAGLVDRHGSIPREDWPEGYEHLRPVRPLWQEDDSWLLPASFSGTIAAFPLEVLQWDLDLTVKHPHHDGCHGAGLWAFHTFAIRSVELARWR